MQAPRSFPPEDTDLLEPVNPRSPDIIDADWEQTEKFSGEPPAASEWNTQPGRTERKSLPRPTRIWLHAGLFFLTCLTCYSVGEELHGGGALYAAGLMAILLSHEMGHYLMARKWGVNASLPFFIPFPSIPYLVISPFGTMGAVITMKSPMPNRRALIDIGAAGPIAGFIVSLVVLTFGLAWSSIVPLPSQWPPPGYFTYVFGDSLLFNGLRYLLLGPVPDGSIVIMHPLAKAGWVGLFVTALNLLPLGQLDGGHITYALFQKHYRRIAFAATGVLLALVFVSYLWLLFALMALFLGRRHPPPIDPHEELDPVRRAVGYISIALFILCFMPDPLQVVGL